MDHPEKGVCEAVVTGLRVVVRLSWPQILHHTGLTNAFFWEQFVPVILKEKKDTIGEEEKRTCVF